MLLNLLDIPVHYINMDKDVERRESMERLLEEKGFKNVVRARGVDGGGEIHDANWRIGCATSHLLLLSQLQPPFIILEDDLRSLDSFKSHIEVPDDSDAIYLGNSSWGLEFGCGVDGAVMWEKATHDLVRVFNMLTTHAILYLTHSYVAACAYAAQKAIYKKDHVDKFIAAIQPDFNVYCCNPPLLTQGSLGTNSTFIKSETHEDFRRFEREPENYRKVFLYWEGEESALILLLRELIYRHSQNQEKYEVVFLTDDNITDHINIPPQWNTLSPVQRADVARVFLLHNYGGIWLDSDTIVIDDLSRLFAFLEKNDGFLIKENNEILWNGVMGSRKGTPLFAEWSKRIAAALGRVDLERSSLGPWMLQSISDETELCANYEILNGLDTVYPINYPGLPHALIDLPKSDAITLEREFQPVFVLVDAVYRLVWDQSREELLEADNPLAYFLNKSLKSSPYFPSVTCLCTTGGRFGLICEAIHQFLSQDYSNKKLLIFNNGEQDLHLDSALLKKGVSLVNAGSNFSTWGKVLNTAIKLVDTEYVAHWDDDDIYLPAHLSKSINILEETGSYCSRARSCWTAVQPRPDDLTVEKQANVLEATWVMRTDFAKQVGYNNNINVGPALGIMEKANELNKSIYLDEITFIYRWGSISQSMHMSAFPDKDSRRIWLETNTDYGNGRVLSLRNTDGLRDSILKEIEVEQLTRGKV